MKIRFFFHEKSGGKKPQRVIKGKGAVDVRALRGGVTWKKVRSTPRDPAGIGPFFPLASQRGEAKIAPPRNYRGEGRGKKVFVVGPPPFCGMCAVWGSGRKR